MPICYELRFEVEETDKLILTSILDSIGETEFVEGSVDCDIEFDYDNLYEHDYYADFASNSPLIIYGENKLHLENVMVNTKKLFSEHLQKDLAVILEPIKDQNWRESWKASFKPVYINNYFCIIPPWENKNDFSQPYIIEIDPGMAFGTGQHETTKLCLTLFAEKYLKTNISLPLNVFDVGAGSGILAIACRKVGVQYALGCDIETESIAIAYENALRNNINNIEFIDTHVSKIEKSNFDLIFANIQNKPLRKIMSDILQKLNKNGTIIISGILDIESQDFCEFLKSLNLQIIKIAKDGHWVGIEATFVL